MKPKIRISIFPDWLYSFIVGLGAMGFFGLLFWLNIWTDIQDHLIGLQQIEAGRWIPPNFLYFLLVYLFSFGKTEVSVTGVTAIVLLGLAVGSKHWLSVSMWQKELGSHKNLLSLLGCGLIVSFSLPTPWSSYLGQVPPNIWHNSTLIFLMPAVLGLYYHTSTFLRNPTATNWGILIGLIFLNLIIKPSFLFAWLPTTLLFAYQGFNQQFWKMAAVISIGGLLILGQYFMVYQVNDHLTNPLYTESSQIAIKPFWLWNQVSESLPISFLFSYAFPMAMIALYPRLLGDKVILYTLGLNITGLLLFVLVVEEGPRALHGNFAWQTIACNYLLFWALMGKWFKNFLKYKWQWKQLASGTFLAAHILSGIYYLLGILWHKTYLF
ncbi:MAG: hypothetical protein AAGI38_13505 [Bacteroidota bacterium]